jgi:tetratricopeptide (TPR) repeat protein
MTSSPKCNQRLCAIDSMTPLPDSQQLLRDANQHVDAGRLHEAEHLYRQILSREPNHASALHGLGIVALKAGHASPAIDLMRRSIELAPQAPTPWLNLASAYRAANRFNEAVTLLQQCLRNFPQNVQVLRDLGATFGMMGRPAESAQAYEQSLRLRASLPAAPDETDERQVDAKVYINIGAALLGMGKLDEAIVAHDRALQLDPNSAVAHMNRGHMLFRKGRLPEAFADYEWRWKIPDFTHKWPIYPQPAWDGSDLKGRSVLLWHEQGMGDTIQFARYAPMVAQRGGKAIVWSQAALVDLLETLEPPVQIANSDGPLPAFDFHLPLLSLPRIFGTTRDSIPRAGGYLKADPQLVERWKERLQNVDSRDKLRVGVVWSGSPGFIDNKNRSMSLATLAPILAVGGVQFFSLQKGEPAEQLKSTPLPRPLIDLGPELTDFAQTAALLKNLDLLITVDTGPAHLAGAIASEVWTMLCFEPDFRWLWDTDRSSWYSSMRLFRQPRPGDWSSVLARVVSELRARVAASGRAPTTSSTTQISRPSLSSAPSQQDGESLLRTASEHHTAGRLEQAEALYRQVLERQPQNASALHHLGLIAFSRGQVAPAIQLLRRSIEIDPSVAFFHKNLATACRVAGNADESARLLRRAIELSAPDPLLLEELGVTLERLDQLGESVAAYEQAIRLLESGPQSPALADSSRRRQFEAKLLMNLGAALERQNRYEQAMPHLEGAIALNPDYGMAHMHRANVLFRRRDLRQAFAEYEWRFRTKGFPTQFRNYPQPVWEGSDLNGRTILLWPEQGLGDTIQFARFAPLVAQRGGKVVLQCMPPLASVLRTASSDVRVVSDQDPLPPFDVHLPLISVPRVLGTTYESLPAPQSYLCADAELAAQGRPQFNVDAPGLRVGLVWSGSPEFPANHRRSIPLESLAPLLRVSGVRLFSLQMGEARKQLATLSGSRQIIDLSSQIHDFADSAAILENLDLLISTDTAIVHLAGALGVQTWVMLWSERDWRWLMDDQVMPWYPSVRPFLQSQMGKWEDVVERIVEDLRRRVKV